MEKTNLYRVKRYLIEEFEVEATSRKDALIEVGIQGDPGIVTILKETVKKTKKQ